MIAFESTRNSGAVRKHYHSIKIFISYPQDDPHLYRPALNVAVPITCRECFSSTLIKILPTHPSYRTNQRVQSMQDIHHSCIDATNSHEQITSSLDPRVCIDCGWGDGIPGIGTGSEIEWLHEISLGYKHRDTTRPSISDPKQRGHLSYTYIVTGDLIFPIALLLIQWLSCLLESPPALPPNPIAIILLEQVDSSGDAFGTHFPHNLHSKFILLMSSVLVWDDSSALRVNQKSIIAWARLEFSPQPR